MKICKFCGHEYHKLANSHIIPEAFYRYTKNEAKKLGMTTDHMLMVTNTKGQFPIRKVWIGWYDQNLVCRKCELLFHPYDDYAIKILLNEEVKHMPIIIDGRISGWEIGKYDFAKFKLFIISLMWRLGASEMPQFKKINLGSDLERAKKLLELKNSGCKDEFSFVFARFADLAGKAYFADPHSELKGDIFGDLKFFRIYLGAGYVAYVKTDKRSFPSLTLPLVASEDKPLLISRRTDFPVSAEYKAFKKVSADSKTALEKIRNKN